MRSAKKLYTLDELARLTSTTLMGDPEHRISGVNSLEEAGPEDASFLANPRYREVMQTSAAGVICVHLSTPPSEGKNFLLSEDPSRAFQILLQHFLASPYPPSGFEGIHPTAVVHPSAKIGQGVQIGPYTVIEQGVEIGENTAIRAHVFIGTGTHVGKNCLFYPHSVVREHCQIGDRVILQPGTVIGSCGFGYITDAKGCHTKLEQLGTVILEDDVEIGANTCIDRARFKATVICSGSKLDNLIQIGHNVSIGPHNIIVAQTGIAGSAKTGRNVVFGGQAGVVGHVEIGDQILIATRGGVSKSIKQAGKYAGTPVLPLGEYNRQQVHLRKIAVYVKQLEEIKARLEELEEEPCE